MVGWKDGCMEVDGWWVGGWMGDWIGGWEDGWWMDGRMDAWGWMDDIDASMAVGRMNEWISTSRDHRGQGPPNEASCLA